MLSRQNPRVKYLRKLGNRRFREKEGAFLIEGVRTVEEALNSPWTVEMLVYSGKLGEIPRGAAVLEKASERGIMTAEVEERVLNEIAMTGTPQGIVALVRQRKAFLEDIRPSGNPVLLVLVDGVQDPGNLGTIVRTAHAAGADGVILLKGTVDLFNPKALRAAVGSVFHVPVVQGGYTADEIMAYLKQRGIKTVAGDVRGTKAVYECDLTVPCALVVGSEAAGVSKEVLRTVSERVLIPMPGRAESLNAAISTVILIYEAVRQRYTKR
ncbi:MAG TPA: RNA methyltransferase [Bacillota bacterium]|nr:RNA methyltransferase [Bacillota bacterium]